MNYIDFRICLKCDNCFISGNSVMCKLNNATLAFEINMPISNELFMFNSNDSEVEKIDERCPEIIEHYIKYSNEKIKYNYKIKESKCKKKKK